MLPATSMPQTPVLVNFKTPFSNCLVTGCRCAAPPASGLILVNLTEQDKGALTSPADDKQGSVWPTR